MNRLIATRRHLVWSVFAAFWTLSATYAQQQPFAPQNLQVLPKDISRQDLIGAMRLFNQALGVQCDHCHVAREFAKDDKPTKNVARAMIRMVHSLRENADTFLPDGRVSKVTCWTCHRGSPTIELPKPPEAAPAKPAGAPKA
jgi:photosynthetic reaction center cytochrome c subunit